MGQVIQQDIINLISSEYKKVEERTRLEREERSKHINVQAEFDKLLSEPEILDVFKRLKDK